MSDTTYPPATIHGENDPRFDPVREEFQRRLDSGDELGASIAATIDGQNGKRRSRSRTSCRTPPG